jgi:UDP-N-acetylmuramoyl-tripeptide--D-alanyl-D-alanine ligase
MSLSFARFLEACQGRFVADATALPAMLRPSTDSRSLIAGETFVCLHGPTYDGHDFIVDALARGAAACVVDDTSKVPRGTNVPVIRVKDAKAAYLAGAKAARAAFRGQLIAVTGSNGKTTTKDFIAQIVGAYRRVLATPNNENNELGVAKLCYRLDDEVDVAICEFGARKPGDIEQLVDIASPAIGILTGVGEAHLEYFRGKEELARTKFAVFSGGARPVCSASDTWSRMLAAEARLDGSTLWVRLLGDPVMSGIMLEAGEVRDERIAITFGASHAFASWVLPGLHNLRNALLAAGAAILAGLSLEEALGAFGRLRLPAGRFESHTLTSGATLVYDAYNASPSSMLASLQTFAALPAARHIAVLGSMAELGDQAANMHRELGVAAGRLSLDELYCGGVFATELAAGARDAGMRAVHTFESNDEMSDCLLREARLGDYILLKGSRVQKMEQILQRLAAPGMLAS